MGGVPERFIGLVLKTSEGATLPWVQIPPPPPNQVLRKIPLLSFGINLDARWLKAIGLIRENLNPNQVST